jgi:hypothetical protein
MAREPLRYNTPIVDAAGFPTDYFTRLWQTLPVGGGGGSVAWADITGKPSTFPPSSHTHPSSQITDFSEAVDDRVASLLVGGTNITLTYNDGAGTLTIDAAAPAPLHGTVALNVPNNAISATETLTATGVTPSSVVMICLAPHSDSDENSEELIDLAGVAATPGTDQITVKAAFLTPHAGLIRFNWSAF